MDPIFDLATDLGQADDILPHPSKLHLYHQSRWGKIRINAGKATSDSERPMEESKTMNNFIIIFFKISKYGNMIGWHLKPRSSCSSTTQDIMIDTFKFTSKSKIWNNFCVGYSIRKLSAHLSPDLYSGRERAKCGGSCWRSLTTNFDHQLLHKREPQSGINASIGFIY